MSDRPHSVRLAGVRPGRFRVPRGSVSVGVVLLLFAGFFGSLAYSQSHAETGADQAILTTESAYIKSAPDASSTDLFMIHEGIKLQLLDHVGEWTKVRLSDGKVGWIQQATYTVI